MPIILADWEIYTVHTGECTWVNPDRVEMRDRRIPVHWSKYVNYRTGTLLYETDTYFGREDYTTQEETFRERLRMTYYYHVDDHDHKERLGWYIELYTQSTMPNAQEITLEEAEEILRGWGIQRLSYEFAPGN